jgi:hypothetical protein
MEPGDDSDEGLMRQVALGRPEAVHALLRRYASPLLTFIQRTVGRRPAKRPAKILRCGPCRWQLMQPSRPTGHYCDGSAAALE